MTMQSAHVHMWRSNKEENLAEKEILVQKKLAKRQFAVEYLKFHMPVVDWLSYILPSKRSEYICTHINNIVKLVDKSLSSN